MHVLVAKQVKPGTNHTYPQNSYAVGGVVANFTVIDDRVAFGLTRPELAS
jgi:hypothetical protein